MVVFIIFGLVHLGVIIASIAIRPCTGDVSDSFGSCRRNTCGMLSKHDVVSTAL